MKLFQFVCIIFILSFGLTVCTSGQRGRIESVEYMMIEEPWASSENLNITINSGSGPPRFLTRSGKDFKPTWSKDGSMLTFFRTYRYGWDFKDWRTTICVINADGTGFRELTSGDYPDFNPTWTRDGSNLIIFNRYSPQGGPHNKVYWISPEGSSGDEVLISDPDFSYYEWALSTLKDGRILVDRLTETSVNSYLLTPQPGKKGLYEELERPTELIWHKLSISPGETKVTYMLDHDNNPSTYNDVVLCYADFNVSSLRIYNQVEITGYNLRYIDEYPKWSRDETLIIYDSNRTGVYQVYACRLEDGQTFRISPEKYDNYQFANFQGLPK
jgi:Tol biopolymer transport system component